MALALLNLESIGLGDRGNQALPRAHLLAEEHFYAGVCLEPPAPDTLVTSARRWHAHVTQVSTFSQPA